MSGADDDWRIGHGFDVHAFGPGDHIRLGGISIPHHRGLIAHSDGDVVAHALADAMLGAAGLPDIGQQFPDSDSRYHGLDGMEMLDCVRALLLNEGLRLWHADTTIVAQQPRLAPYLDAMRSALGKTLGIAPRPVGIKATTTERLGAIGNEQGIAVYAVVLLRPA